LRSIRKILFFNIIVAVVGFLAVMNITRSTVAAVQVLEPGYVVEIYATFSEPAIGSSRGMTFDDNGNLYVVQHTDGSVWKVTPDAYASEFVSGLNLPRGIVWTGGTSYGNYLYATNSETIVRIALDGTSTNFANMFDHGSTVIAMDKTGNYGGYIYTASSASDRIFQVDTSGNVTSFGTFPGWTSGGGPYGIDFDPGTNYGGSMYVATSYSSTPNLSGVFVLDIIGNATRFTNDLASGLFLKFDRTGDFDGEMFLSANRVVTGQRKIWCVHSDGTATEFAETTVSNPCGLAFGPDGAMYVAEYNANSETVIISRISKYIEPPIECPAEYALEFDGVDDIINIPDSDVFDFGTDDFSISLWFNTTGVINPYGEQYIVDFRQNDNNPHIEIYTAQGYLGTHILPSDIRIGYNIARVDDGQWHQTTVTLDNGATNGYKLYLDGALAGQESASGALGDWHTIKIGGDDVHRPEYFNGRIDNVAIYNRALSVGEVQQIYCLGAATEPNLIGFWDLDEGQGQVAYDMSGNGNDGYLGSDPCNVDNSDPMWVESDVPSPFVYYVDDDANGDPCHGVPGAFAGEPGLSDPFEGGKCNHPFDSIQKAINNIPVDANICTPTIIVLDGTYSGVGNYDIDTFGLAVTIKSQNGPKNCIIDCNNQGKGFICQSGEGLDTVIDGFTITDGNAAEYGGGIDCNTGSPTINNCVITGNYAGWSGGAIFCQDSNAVITNCIMMDNFCESSGAGICGVGGFPVIKNCLIAYNDGYFSGGASSIYDCNMTFINCTIADNFASHSHLVTGGVYCWDGDVNIVNTILWDNNSPNNNQIEFFIRDEIAVVNYSDVQIGDSNFVWAGIGNLNDDPLFTAPELGDYHLKSTAGRWVQMLESNGDLNGDDIVDWLDLEIFVDSWLYTGPEILSDMYHEGVVNFNDFAAFASNWRTTGQNRADFDDSGFVDWVDLGMFTAHWLDIGPRITADIYRETLINFKDYAVLASNWLLPGENIPGWVYSDTESSPCIDAGDPTYDYSQELEPNGGRINMGVYGNTEYASKSP
jgi:hypothetical protein